MKSSGVIQNSVAYYHAYRYSLHDNSSSHNKYATMHGARRLVVFCLLTAVLPTILIIIPLYLRHNVFRDVSYTVAESDVLELNGMSTIFCQEHTLRMNSSFNSYQVEKKPEISNTRKHIRLKKRMQLPDDTLEYWGFFLPVGSTVKLSLCSTFRGSNVIVVRGERNLNFCSLLDQVKQRPSEPFQSRARFEIDIPKQISDNNQGGEEIDNDESKLQYLIREKREVVQPHNLDGKVVHGGNTAVEDELDETSSQSSFENALFDCFNGKILHKQSLIASETCSNSSSIMSNLTTHITISDGYYYYIFYSDNDHVHNDILAVFDIHKPTYQLANITKKCINETECNFPLAIFAQEIVIVEVPTRDGIEHEEEDLTLLVSICHPRMGVYIIFPLLVLILILGCAFL